MVSGLISRLVILIFGTLYPAYASYKAVRTKNVKEYVKWMMYWIVFALFTCAETFTDLFLSFWFPFYYEIKIITVIYLLSPATRGSSILYRKFVHPVLTRREQEIDEYIAKAKEQGYHTMLNLGSKGVNYATSLIMQTAIKGGGGLVNQLRKSYSLSDLTKEQNGSVTDGGGHKLIRRNQAQQHSGQILLPQNHSGFYSPEADLYQERIDANGEIFFPEDIGPGYSNGDPLYYNMRRSKEHVLVRTASLGPCSRTRTRALTKNGLPKGASLSEEGSTHSALEPRESQNETNNLNYPLSHSASYPFPLTSFQPYFISQFQPTLGNVVDNQMLTFINHSQYSQFLNNRTVTIQNALGSVVGYQTDGDLGDQSMYIVEENSNNSGTINSVDDDSDAAGEEQIDGNEDGTQNPASRKSKNREVKLREIENLGEKEERETKKENIFTSPNKSINEKQQPERSGKYNKKPAPTPPIEQSNPKLASDLRVDDEESEFYTPNASPKSLRKQSTSELHMLRDKSDTDSCSECKTQANTTVEIPKKSKMKKGDFSISRKLYMPKVSFSFWHQKDGKLTSNSDSSSVGRVQSASTNSETQGNTELFIPLRDYNESEEESLKYDSGKIKTGINQ